MKVLVLCSVFIAYTLTVITKVVSAQTGPDVKKSNSNELRVRALLNLSSPGLTSKSDTKEVILNVPSNGEMVYKEIGGQNVNKGARVVWDGDQSRQNAQVTCFFWRQSNVKIPWEMGLNFASTPIYPMGKGIPYSYQRADRLYCFDSTADTVHLEDIGSTSDDIQSYNLRATDRKIREKIDNSVGTFTLLFEYRFGRQALIRLRSEPGSSNTTLDFSDADAVATSMTSGIEPGINVVRVALIDTPRPASDEIYRGVNANLYEREPRCLLILSSASQRAVLVGRGTTFEPYINIYGIRCVRAMMWAEPGQI